MNAVSLRQLTADALDLAGAPCWPAVDAPEEYDVLTCLEQDGRHYWAIVPAECDSEAGLVSPAKDIEKDEIYEVDTRLAASLIREHLRATLLEQSWQVQLRDSAARREWRLVDCLAVADGGADRLDEAYPSGLDELDVLCQSVAVVRHARTRGRGFRGMIQ